MNETVTCEACGKVIDRTSDFVHFMHEEDCVEMDVGWCNCDRTFCEEHCPLCSEAEE
jgi:hypothetical protein